MTLNKQPALDAIEKEQNTILHVADEIWDYAELSLQEFRSAKLYCEVLKQEGFRVEEGVCGIATAFAASFGSGRPHIGILAEYDALSGLSQQGGQLVHAERTPGGTGHGCGHNLLGAGALAAAIGVKAWLEQTGCPGTVTLYGCPGEEGGAAKAFMARDGLWKQLDAARHTKSRRAGARRLFVYGSGIGGGMGSVRKDDQRKMERTTSAAPHTRCPSQLVSGYQNQRGSASASFGIGGLLYRNVECFALMAIFP